MAWSIPWERCEVFRNYENALDASAHTHPCCIRKRDSLSAIQCICLNAELERGETSASEVIPLFLQPLTIFGNGLGNFIASASCWRG